MVVLRDEYLPKIVEYFKKNMAKGYKIDQLKFALISQGQSRVLIDKAMEVVQKEIQDKAAEKPKMFEQPKVEVIEEEPRKKGFFSRLFG